MTTRARGWCITINNYTNQDLIDWWEADADYAIFGFEIGESGTPHMQGYMYFENKITGKGLSKKLPRSSNRIAKGSAEQNKSYCSKQEDFYEYGSIPKQGERTDLSDMVSAIQEGATDTDLIHMNPTNFVRYGKGLQAVRSAFMEHRTDPPTVEWIWGPTGCGKTRYATEKGNFYIKDHTMWWDGYMQQEVIVIDDFDGKWPFRDLLRLLDRYPYQGQVKGGFVKINSPHIIITCDKCPEVLFRQLKAHELSQLLRRISIIQEKCPEVSGNNRALTEEEELEPFLTIVS